MTSELEAFSDVDFSWVKPLESVWSADAAFPAGPNDDLEDSIVADLLRQTKDPRLKPVGRVLVGPAGVGKTHLVGNLRRKVWAASGWFVLLDVIGLTDFWKSAALSFLTSLLQEMPDGRRQYEAVLAGVARRLNVEAQVEAAFRIANIEAKRIVDLLVPGLAKIDFAKAQQHQDVFRALALLRAHDFTAVGIAHAWLQGYEADEERRRALGLTRPPPTPIELVQGMSWIMSIAGPTLVAVDQIDGVINSGNVSIGRGEVFEEIKLSDVLSGGLLQLYDALTRGQTIVTCLLDSWLVLRNDLKSTRDRFEEEPKRLRAMTDSAFISALIEHRLHASFHGLGYRPDFPTWPFTPAAIESARGLMPRQILMACDRHRRNCIAANAVSLCQSLTLEDGDVVLVERKASFEVDYGVARKDAQTNGLIDDRDDGELGRLLRDAFSIYAQQLEPCADIDIVCQGDSTQRMPPLHGRLTFTFHAEKDREEHYCFRALEHANANAYSARLRAAVTASGIGSSIPCRQLLIVRRGPIPSGPRTRQLHEAFLAAGGKIIDPVDEDLRCFVALRTIRASALQDGKLAEFEAWLRATKPLCNTNFFQAAGLCQPTGLPSDVRGPLPPAPAGGTSAPPPSKAPTREPQRPPEAVPPAPPPPPPAPTPSPGTIPIGVRAIGGEPVSLHTHLLPRHTAIIAGSGSGKTVLLRRIVEEAALAGIPAIVIDPNNDLSCLGDPWLAPPIGFSDADEARAQRYQDEVEVVVWTPGVHAGNPLFLSVLPDFAAVGGDQDERDQAVAMAAATLGPLAGAKTTLSQGVLAGALHSFAETGGGTLGQMIDLLDNLPDNASDIKKAATLAAKMADELRAAVATNPLLRVAGPVLDPKTLFFGKDPDRTRISVINLSGLASDDSKEDFVNRLQMTLFGWIKRYPSPKGMLYVIDEAQTFMPAGRGALSKTSGVQLVSQARKYGMGMIVATQAPKGIDNKVIANCSTQFLGKQNAPANIDAAKEMIAASGGRADDMAKLSSGEFYYKTEGSGKPFKVKTPWCLSRHPRNPPTPEEVVAKAKLAAAANR
jgi:hypothetical protein